MGKLSECVHIAIDSNGTTHPEDAVETAPPAGSAKAASADGEQASGAAAGGGAGPRQQQQEKSPEPEAPAPQPQRKDEAAAAGQQPAGGSAANAPSSGKEQNYEEKQAQQPESKAEPEPEPQPASKIIFTLFLRSRNSAISWKSPSSVYEVKGQEQTKCFGSRFKSTKSNQISFAETSRALLAVHGYLQPSLFSTSATNA